MLTKSNFKQFVGNKIFTVVFLKKDGSLRHMTGRLGVKKYVKGTGYAKPDNIVTVFEMQKKQYRSFDVDRVKEIKCNGEILKNE